MVNITFQIFKKHPFGILAIILWVLAGIIDVLDLLICFAVGDIGSGIMDLLVIIALICYIFAPSIAKNSSDPIKSTKKLFVLFACISVIADIIYAIIATSSGYRLTEFYTFTIIMDVLLTLFTILGVNTTMKGLKDFSEFSQKQPYAQQQQYTQQQQYAQQRFCNQCGKELLKDSKFCAFCGAKNQ